MPEQRRAGQLVYFKTLMKSLNFSSSQTGGMEVGYQVFHNVIPIRSTRFQTSSS